MVKAQKRLDEARIDGNDRTDRNRTAELRDARELAAAREEFAAGIRELPGTYRDHALADDDSGPDLGARWSPGQDRRVLAATPRTEAYRAGHGVDVAGP